MQVLTVEFVIAPERVDDFAAAIVANARASRESETGCRQFDVSRDAADPTRFLLYELYDDEAAVQAHLQAPHFHAMNAATAAWVQRKTVWRTVRIDP